MDRFVRRQNLQRFAELLESEPELPKRQQLRSLLIEEICRFETTRERLQELEELIMRTRKRVYSQEHKLATLFPLDGEKVRAEQVLGRMMSTLQLLISHRDGLI